MTSVMQWKQGERLSADVFRQRMSIRKDAVAHLKTLFSGVETPLVEALQKISSAAVKSSLSSITLKTLDLKECEQDLFCLNSVRGRVRTYLSFDRGFEHLACELALGGSGVDPNPEDSNRPSSNFERKLLGHICRLIAGQLCGYFKLLAGAAFELETSQSPEAKPSKVLQEPCVVISLLVNAFSYSGEVRLVLPQDDVRNVLDTTVPKAPVAKITGAEAMAGCKFDLSVFLEPMSIELRTIASLEVGKLLPLEIRPNAPVFVRYQSQDLFKGGFNFGADKHDVRLTDAI